MESLASNFIRKLATTVVYLYLYVCLSVHVRVCLFLCMHGRGSETAVLFVSVKLPNYLIMVLTIIVSDCYDTDGRTKADK